MECQFSPLCQSNMIRKDPIFKTLMLSRKGTVERPSDVNDPLRFAGDGVTFRAKLIGVLEVNAPRGDRLCQEALGELKMAIKAAGEHKQRIMICIALDGLRLRDERTGDCLYHHAVHKISFIAQDMADPRAFGYIFGSPDQGHRFFGIKTDKHANLVVVAMRDLFQVVYDLKKKDVEKNKQYPFDSSGNKTNGDRHLTDSMDSLDQMLALGSHLNGGRSEMSAIQTADLLNLHAEEKSSSSFDPFATSFNPTSLSNSMVVKPIASVPLLSMPPAIPPPPSTVGMLSCGPTTVSQPDQLKPTVSDNFSDSFVSLAPPHQLTPLVPPPTKSPKVKSSSSTMSHYSTIRPRKKSGNDKDSTSEPTYLPKQTFLPTEMPITVNALPIPSATKLSSLNVRNIKGNISPRLNSAATLPRPTSANSSTNSSPRVVDGFDSQPFTANFFVEPAPVALTERADVFTELDPLGTGRSRPYIDKKDFFQDLKKTSLGSKMLLKQLSISQVESVDHQHAKDWHAQLSEDPFGSLHFGPLPEADPFDTKFASMAPPLFSAAFQSSPLVQSSSPPKSISPTGYSKVSKAIKSTSPRPTNSVPSSFTSTPLSAPAAKSSPSRYPRGLLRVTLPVSHSDSDSEITSEILQLPSSPNQARRNQPASGTQENSARSCSPRSSASQLSTHVGSFNLDTGNTSTNGTGDSPLPPQELSSSEDDSSSSSVEDGQLRRDHSQHSQSPQHHLRPLQPESTTGSATLSMPPQPPPRPPVLRPPPLPPKGQPPLVPQRPVVTPTDELIYSGHQTPPLPIPIRKPKQPVSVSNSHSRGQSASHHTSRENGDEPRPVKPIQSKLNQISLLQLSNMSLAELADTLQLPPARLASMTLTELALRLAELNKNDVKTETKKMRHSEKKFPSSPLYHSAARRKDEDDEGVEEEEVEQEDEEDVEEEEEEEEDEEEEEEEEEPEEEEPEPVAVEVDETEICYKGGKKYEILSDVPEPEDDSATRLSKTCTTANTQLDARTPEISKVSDSDRYAALREIMEQDLAVSSCTRTEEKEENDRFSEFANFDDMNVLAYSAPQEANVPCSGTPLTSTRKITSPLFGFEDDFCHIQLNRLTESPYDNTGARPKTTGHPPYPRGNSVSSGSAEFDHFVEEELAVKPTGVSITWSCPEPVDFKLPETPDDEEPEQMEPVGNEDDEVVDDLADKFAAFEARFPANPLEGFGDSFADYDLSANTTVVEPKAPLVSDSFTVDFSAAFNEEKASEDQLKTIEKQTVKKSTSVNIFTRVDDPFDDDFFQPDLPPVKTNSSASSNSHVVKQPSVQVFSTIVEDPFAWVQPFDDNIQFDDVGDDFTL